MDDHDRIRSCERERVESGSVYDHDRIKLLDAKSLLSYITNFSVKARHVSGCPTGPTPRPHSGAHFYQTKASTQLRPDDMAVRADLEQAREMLAKEAGEYRPSI